MQFLNEENVLDETNFRLAERLNSHFVDLELREVEPSQLNSAKNRNHYRAIANWLTQYQPEATSSDNLEAALKIFIEIGDRSNQANALKSLAELYQELGQINTASSFADQALSIGVELGIPLVEEIRNLKILIISALNEEEA